MWRCGYGCADEDYDTVVVVGIDSVKEYVVAHAAVSVGGKGTMCHCLQQVCRLLLLKVGL